MKDETRVSLELFVEKAEELRLCNFAKYVIDSSPVHLQVSIGSKIRERVEYTGPDDEAMKAFLLTLRFFIQDRDGISFRYLERDVCQDSALSAQWKQEIKNARAHLHEYLNERSTPVIVYEPPPTRQEIVDTFIYGSLAHADKKHRDQFKRWKQKEIMFSNYKMDFHAALFTMFSMIMYISGLTEQELKAQSTHP